MRKLSESAIDEITRSYQKGCPVSELADLYSVSKLTIYCHLRKNIPHKYIKNPTCYKDFLINSIYIINKKLKNGEIEYEKQKFARSEIRRLKFAIKECSKREVIDEEA